MPVTRHAREAARQLADGRVGAQKDEYRRKIERIQSSFDPPLSNAELSVGLDLDEPGSQASTLGRFVSTSPRLARARPDGATRALIDSIVDGDLLVAVSPSVPGAKRQVVIGDARDFLRLARGWTLRKISGGELPPELARRMESDADWDDGEHWDLFGAADSGQGGPAAQTHFDQLPRHVAGRDVFPVGLGAMRLSTKGRPTDEQALEVLRAAFEACPADAVQLIDTADVYCLGEDDLGHNEELIRRAVESYFGRPQSERVLVATKAGLERPGGRWRPNGRPEHLRAACEASLGRLGGEAIDLLQLHTPDPKVPLADSVGELARLRDEGKVRHVGLCNVSAVQLDEALGIVPIAAVQVAAGVFDLAPFARTEGGEGSGGSDSDGGGSLTERCHTAGIALIAHSPLGGHRRADRAGREEELRKVAGEMAGEVAGDLDVSPWQVALAWLLAMGPGIVPIPGATKVENVTANAEALRLRLTAEQLAKIETGRRAQAPEQRRRIWQVARPPERAVLLMGPPAAGKTSRVDAYVARGYTRLNRDAVGGSIADLHRRMAQLADEGERSFVLDNTYPTRASRQGALDVASRFGLETVGVHLDVPVGEALMNACFRMIERHGRVLSPEEIKAASKDDPNMLPPAAVYHFYSQWQAPTESEGFQRVETVPFVRRPPADGGQPGQRALLLDVDGTLRQTRSGAPYPVDPDDIEILPGRKEVLNRHARDGWKLLGISNQSGIGRGQTTAEIVEACFERTCELLGHDLDILYCPHPADNAGVWCRKPMPGMVVTHIVRHHLDRDRCLVVGDLDSDRELAELCGIEFRWADDFF